MAKKLNIGVLISGSGSNLQAIIDSCEQKKIDAQVVFVGADNPDAFGLERAKKHDIPVFVVNYKNIFKNIKLKPELAKVPIDCDLESVFLKQSLFKTKEDLIKRLIAERELLENIKKYDFDLLILAGFMRNLSPYFIDKININPEKPRIMNIHPALLPSFPGTDGYGDTIRYGCKIGGCTVHFIDYGEDSGPIIGQRAFQIEPEDNLENIKKKGLNLEWELYSECIKLFIDKRLEVIENNQKKIIKILKKTVDMR